MHEPRARGHDLLAGLFRVQPEVLLEQIRQVREDLVREGYVQIDGLFDQVLIERLANGIRTLRSGGLLPVLAFLFDDYWALSRRLQGLLGAVLGPLGLGLVLIWVALVGGLLALAGRVRGRRAVVLGPAFAVGYAIAVAVW